MQGPLTLAFTFWQQETVTQPSGEVDIITEAGDTIVTEAGDTVVDEDSP